MQNFYSILKTQVGYLAGLEYKVDNLIISLVQNNLYKENGVVFTDHSLFLRNIQVNTPITLLFEKLASSQKLNNLAYIYIPPSYPNYQKVQSLLNIPFITYYLKESKNYSAIAHIPELADKVLFNLSNVIRENKLTGEKIPADMGSIHSTYIRAYAHYDYMNSKDMWLPMDLSLDLLHLYTYYFVANIHSKLYLTVDEISIIRALIGMYFTSLIVFDANLRYRLLMSSTFLGTKSLLDDLYSRYLRTHTSFLSIDNITEIAQDFTDFPRIKDLLTYSNLIRIAKSLNPDVNISLLSLEFPPYWASSILATMSFAKSHLYFTLKKDRAMVTTMQRFVTNYIRHMTNK